MALPVKYTYTYTRYPTRRNAVFSGVVLARKLVELVDKYCSKNVRTRASCTDGLLTECIRAFTACSGDIFSVENSKPFDGKPKRMPRTEIFEFVRAFYIIALCKSLATVHRVSSFSERRIPPSLHISRARAATSQSTTLLFTRVCRRQYPYTSDTRRNLYFRERVRHNTAATSSAICDRISTKTFAVTAVVRLTRSRRRTLLYILTATRIVGRTYVLQRSREESYIFF